MCLLITALLWPTWHFRGDLKDARPPSVFFCCSSKHTLEASQGPKGLDDSLLL